MGIKWNKTVIYYDESWTKKNKFFEKCIDAEKFFKKNRQYCKCFKCKTRTFSFDRKHITRYVKNDVCDLTKRMCNTCTRSNVLSTFLKNNKNFNKERCRQLGNNPESHEKVELRNKHLNKKPTYIYVAKLSNGNYKVGITINLKSRKSHKKYLYYVFTYLCKTRIQAAKLERYIKETYCKTNEEFEKDKLNKVLNFLKNKI